MPPPFLVVGFPRSRTAWLARFLGAVHEPSLRWSSLADLRAALVDRWGASDSMLSFVAAEARAIRPDTRIVLVRRRRADVEASLARLDVVLPAWFLDALERALAAVERDLKPLVVGFDDLADPAICGGVHAWCLDRPMDRGRWERLAAENIQSDIRATLRLVAERDRELGQLFGPYYGRPPVTIGWEPLARLRAAGMARLTERQWVEAGLDPGETAPLDVDWDRYAALEREGVFRLLSARRGDELVGWGAYFFMPHLQFKTTPHILCDSIYVTPEHRGIAPSLIRAAEREARTAGRPVRIVYCARDVRFGALLERLAYRQVETVHWKLIGAPL